MARFTCCRWAAITCNLEARRHGLRHRAQDQCGRAQSRWANRSKARPSPAIAGPVRTEDLNQEEIAAVEAEMEPRFEHLDAELDPAGASVVDLGVDFGRKLRARGDAAKGRPVDKAFRDSLFDDS